MGVGRRFLYSGGFCVSVAGGCYYSGRGAFSLQGEGVVFFIGGGVIVSTVNSPPPPQLVS